MAVIGGGLSGYSLGLGLDEFIGQLYNTGDYPLWLVGLGFGLGIGMLVAATIRS